MNPKEFCDAILPVRTKRTREGLIVVFVPIAISGYVVLRTRLRRPHAVTVVHSTGAFLRNYGVVADD
jgi:hypothetical protein